MDDSTETNDKYLNDPEGEDSRERLGRDAKFYGIGDGVVGDRNVIASKVSSGDSESKPRILNWKTGVMEKKLFKMRGSRVTNRPKPGAKRGRPRKNHSFRIIVPSESESPLLLVDGFQLKFQRLSYLAEESSALFRCVRPSCSATAGVKGYVEEEEEGGASLKFHKMESHDHPPDHAASIVAVKMFDLWLTAVLGDASSSPLAAYLRVRGEANEAASDFDIDEDITKMFPPFEEVEGTYLHLRARYGFGKVPPCLDPRAAMRNANAVVGKPPKKFAKNNTRKMDDKASRGFSSFGCPRGFRASLLRASSEITTNSSPEFKNFRVTCCPNCGFGVTKYADASSQTRHVANFEKMPARFESAVHDRPFPRVEEEEEEEEAAAAEVEEEEPANEKDPDDSEEDDDDGVEGEVFFSESRNDKIQLHHRGFTLCVNKRGDNFFYFRCVVGKGKTQCNATARIVGELKEGKFKLLYHRIEKHNHEPCPVELRLRQFRNDFKREARRREGVPITKIYEELKVKLLLGMSPAERDIALAKMPSQKGALNVGYKARRKGYNSSLWEGMEEETEKPGGREEPDEPDFPPESSPLPLFESINDDGDPSAENASAKGFCGNADEGYRSERLEESFQGTNEAPSECAVSKRSMGIAHHAFQRAPLETDNSDDYDESLRVSLPRPFSGRDSQSYEKCNSRSEFKNFTMRCCPNCGRGMKKFAEVSTETRRVVNAEPISLGRSFLPVDAEGEREEYEIEGVGDDQLSSEGFTLDQKPNFDLAI